MPSLQHMLQFLGQPQVTGFEGTGAATAGDISPIGGKLDIRLMDSGTRERTLVP